MVMQYRYMNNDIAMEWNVWSKMQMQSTGNKSISKSEGEGMTTCMVDNDRFCALINVNRSKKSYLYAMNETKLCIPLADCCENRENAMSLYHEFYHKIITIGDGSAEYYDINQDKSMIFSRFDWKNVDNVYYSPFNPNILYGTTMEKTSARFSDKAEIGLFQIDLRDGNTKSHSLIKASEGNTRLWSAVYLRM